jgi:L-seryl-tRNA(Ser) seleniumtransferase
VGLAELVALGRAAGLPVVDDLGSGSLLDTAAFGLAREPMVQESIAAGADLVAFSGDKLLGGPQAGLILGRRELVERLRRHPFTRALRPGKDVLAGLHATLLHYLLGEATTAIPVWRMIAAPVEEITARAGSWRAALQANGVAVELLPGQSTVGGGSLPGETLATTLVTLRGPAPDALVAALRRAAVPVVGRIQDERVVLDPRTVLPGEDEALLGAVIGAFPAQTF